jgi:PHP family Zn ribbon phosphoesterase
LEKDRTSVLLDREVMVKLKAISMATRKPMNFLIQEATTEYIAKLAPKKKMEIIGMVDSGDPHFADNVEEYLKESGFGED